jgi:cytochrome c oxidase assembly protein subunit 11
MKTQTNISKKNRRLTIKIGIGVVLMFGFCYALVPLYSLVCKQEGINGRSTLRDQENSGVLVDKSRTITVEFTTTIHGEVNFKFRPLISHIDIHPGETKQVYFYAENDTGHNIIVQAIPSIAPGIAAKYLKKTQCFCFTQQAFSSHEKAEMPVIFHVDPEIPKDVTFFTLNYTLFDASDYIKNQKHFTAGRIEI